jgi:photosystem II stability/assembly factor-like uncharacterized protein
MAGANVPNEDHLLLHSPSPPRWWRRTALLLGILLTCILVFALFDGCTPLVSGQRHVTSGRYCSGCSGTPEMIGISMVSADDGWAVGRTVGGDPTRSEGVIAHYQNGHWRQVTPPASTLKLNSVAMVSASDGWIVGDGGTILHYTGGRWVSVASPTHDILSGVFMLSATDGWAVSLEGSILHYNGTVWELVTTSSPLRLLWSVYMVSPGEGWAVGLNVIVRYHHGAWTTLNLAGLPGFPYVTDLRSVAMISANEGWAVGDGPQGAAIILHYQNDQWYLDASAPKVTGLLSAVALVSPDEGWAVGSGSGGAGSSLIVHFTRVGGWARVNTALHVDFTALSMLSPTDGWAVGDEINYVHYGDGKWG